MRFPWLFIVVPVLAATSTAQAFTQCATKALAGPGAVIAEEGGNPVWWAGWVYAGFMQGSTIAVAASSDYGQTMGPPVKISSNAGAAYHLRMSASYPHVYALWGHNTTAGRQLSFSASHNHGATWDKVTDISLYAAALPQIATDVDTVHVIYLQNDGMVAIRNSTDDGHTFSAPVPIAPGWGEIVATSLGQNVYVSWNLLLSSGRYDVIMAVSHDGGKTFKVDDLSASRPSSATEPIFALDKIGGRVSLVWREAVPVQGMYLQSRDNGVTWSAPTVLDQPARQFMIADDGTYIYASYLKRATIGGVYDWQVQYVVSGDGGRTFSKPVNLTGPSGISSFEDDEDRPIPWVWDGNGAFRLTGMKADGVYAWNGRSGTVGKGTYLGPGDTATPAYNSVLWQSPNKVVSYGYCE